MSKYKFVGLTIELTRRCNKQCAHCGRGPAQDLTMPEKMIDTIIDNVDDCYSVYVSSGEPLLELDRLEYLLNKISQWPTLKQVEVTTNGSLLSRRFVDMYEKFCAESCGRTATISLSKDKYHTKGDYERAVEFYRPLVDAANKRLGVTGDKGIKIRDSIIADKILIYSGNAKQIVDSGKAIFSKLPCMSNHRLKIINNVVQCTVMICANGNVILAAEDDSYETYDNIASGNIMQETLDDIIDRHQNNCLLLCEEANIFDYDAVRETFAMYEPIEDLRISIFKEIALRILELRSKIKSMYPELTPSDIIASLPMPKTDQEYWGLVELLYTKNSFGNDIQSMIDRLGDELVDKFYADKDCMTQEESFQRLILMTVLAFLKDDRVVDFLADNVFNQGIGLLRVKASLYRLGGTPDNSQVFPCGGTKLLGNKYHDEQWDLLLKQLKGGDSEGNTDGE